MGSDYYDIDDIIAENERIQCKFNIDVQGLGYLEDSGKDKISENSKVDLPVWLAGILSGIPMVLEGGEEIRVLDLIKPEAFNKKVINSIKANNLTLALRAILPHYYKLAEKWGFWFQDAEFIEVIKTMYKDRCIVINDYSLHSSNSTSSNEEISRFIYGLDEAEKQVFAMCLASHKDSKSWFNEYL